MAIASLSDPDPSIERALAEHSRSEVCDSQDDCHSLHMKRYSAAKPDAQLVAGPTEDAGTLSLTI
jgi:hypothetical protein